MKWKPLTILADDLTGACELAAIGHRWGLTAVVSMDLDLPPGAAGVVVYDTETRLLDGPDAASRIAAALPALREQRAGRAFYKKTDSVLRGPVAAELDTLAGGLGYPRILFIPANPGLGRTVKGGVYRINGVPLHETAFARDLHHPARSSVVRERLAMPAGTPVCEAGPADPLPARGVVIGDAGSAADLALWAARLTGDTLPAGAAAFFEAILRHHMGDPPASPAPPVVAGKQLLVSGTVDPAQQAELEAARQGGCAAVTRSLDQLVAGCGQPWGEAIRMALAGPSHCLAYVDNRQPPDTAKSGAVRESLATACAVALRDDTVAHLIVEGGATAASIAERLGWSRFEVVHAWAQGIVTLRPLARPGLLFSLKPGSYPWPDAFKRIIFNTPRGEHQHA